MDSATIFAILAMITAVGMGSMTGSPKKGGSVQRGGKSTRRHKMRKNKTRKN